MCGHGAIDHGTIHRMAADLWGVGDGYHDGRGQWHDAPYESRAALRRAFGADLAGAPADPLDDVVRVALVGSNTRAGFTGELVAEDGGTERVREDFNLGSLPPGYYTWKDRLVIVAPARCPTPEGRLWGWAVQLYALWSGRSTGIGDLGDLATFGAWATSTGADVLLISPLHAPAPSPSQVDSPYYPSSRVFRNPLHLRAGPAIAPGSRIDRNAVWAVKRAALWAQWELVGGRRDTGFERYRAQQGQPLSDFATHCALVETLGEQHGPDWRRWPEAFRRPDAHGVASFRAEQAARHDLIGFFSWLQYRLDEQIAEAAQQIGLIADFAVGVDRSGADAWVWQDRYCLELSVGAPPDVFNAGGQDWGLPPYDPWKLRAGHYDALRSSLRSAFRHARGVRIDHVMGMFRLWLVEIGGAPTTGCYAYLPFAEYMAVVAVEAHRSAAFVVGEDLGTVEPYVRDELARRQILSYRVLQFEDGGADLPALALAAATTHDLPTLAGLWTGGDAEAQRRVGIAVSGESLAATQQSREALAKRCAVAIDASASTVIDEVHRTLGALDCLIVTATLDDALGVLERPNLPGTIDEWPNWRIPLPRPVEDLITDPGVNRTARLLREARPRLDQHAPVTSAKVR